MSEQRRLSFDEGTEALDPQVERVTRRLREGALGPPRK